LKLTGYVRGQSMSVNRLVHISGLGDFQLSQIDVLDDPHPLTKSDKHKHKAGDSQVFVSYLLNLLTYFHVICIE
jgi:pre-rRNA-processing protein TSR1